MAEAATTFPINVIINPSGATTGGRKVKRELADIEKRAGGLKRALAKVFAGFGAALGIRQLVRFADQFTNLQNRIRAVIPDVAQLGAVTEKLFHVANDTRQAFRLTAQIYQRVAIGTKDLGISTERVIGLVNTLQKAVVLSGAGAMEARGGLIQFAQGLAAGELRGQELRSVLEQLPVLAGVIAKSFGVSRGQLIALGEAGEITTKKLLLALEAEADAIDEAFKRTIPTIAQSFNILKNHMLRFVGETNNAVGVTKILGGAIIGLGKNIEPVARAFIALGVAIGVKYAVQAVPAAIAATRQLIVMMAALNTTLFMNPLGPLLIGLGAVIGLLVAFSDKINVGEGQFVSLADTAKALVQEMVVSLKKFGTFVKDVFGGLADDFRDFFGKEMGSAFRGFVRDSARVVDAVLGLFAGLHAAIRELFLNSSFQLGASFKLVFGTIVKQGEIAFKKLANSIVDFFTAPLAFLARSFADLLGAFGGALAVLRNLKLISEETRINFEDSLTEVEMLARGKAGADNPNLPYTKSDLDQLEVELIGFINKQQAAIIKAKGETPEEVFARLREAFAKGFAGFAGAQGAEAFVDRVFARVDAAIAKRREEALQAAKEMAEIMPPLSKRALEILTEINKPMVTLKANLAALQQLLTRKLPKSDEFLISADEFTTTLDTMTLKALKTATSMEAGFIRAFVAIRREARDFASVVEDVFDTVLGSIEDIIVQFTTTGKASFKEFANAIVSDLMRIFTRLLLLQAINAFLPGASVFASAALNLGGGGKESSGLDLGGGGGDSGAAGASPGFSPSPAPMVAAESSPRISGPSSPNIPGGGTVAGLDVTIVNVQSDEEIPGALQTRAGDRFVVNKISTNKKVARRAMA